MLPSIGVDDALVLRKAFSLEKSLRHFLIGARAPQALHPLRIVVVVGAGVLRVEMT